MISGHVKQARETPAQAESPRTGFTWPVHSFRLGATAAADIRVPLQPSVIALALNSI